MDLTICSNCGCNMTKDDDPMSPYIMTLHAPDPDVQGGETVRTYQLCRCCADGIRKLLDGNERVLLNMHGETCCDILPINYRCVHSEPTHGYGC